VKGVPRKALVAFVIAAAAAAFGVSAAAAPRVSFQIRPTAILYGQNILLKGKIPAGRAKENVVVKAQVCHFRGAVTVRTLVTRKGGAFSFRVGPTLRTAYSVSWGKAKSRAITVHVAPQVAVKKIGRRAFSISVSAGGGSTFKDKRAFLQRQQGRRWRVIGSVKLKLVSPPDAMTAVSSGTVRAKVKRGTQLRAVFPLAQAKPCYRAGASGAISG
jgi:hypothetical protein